MNRKQITQKHYQRSKDLIFGYSRQIKCHTMPIVMNCTILKYYYNKYPKDELENRISDILFTVFDGIELITNTIKNYLSFKKCRSCYSVAWCDQFKRIKCNECNKHFCSECDETLKCNGCGSTICVSCEDDWVGCDVCHKSFCDGCHFFVSNGMCDECQGDECDICGSDERNVDVSSKCCNCKNLLCDSCKKECLCTCMKCGGEYIYCGNYCDKSTICHSCNCYVLEDYCEQQGCKCNE
eukprot:435287_1